MKVDMISNKKLKENFLSTLEQIVADDQFKTNLNEIFRLMIYVAPKQEGGDPLVGVEKECGLIE
jgi:hypothetical protein